MTISPIAAAACSLCGNALLSLGMILQKRNVSWIGRAGPKDAAFRRAFLAWFAGFMMVNVVPAFNYVALLGLPANVVAAATGSSVAFTALLAVPLLGERIGPRRAASSALLLAAIAVAGLRGAAARSGAASAAFSPGPIFLAAALPAAAGAIALLVRARVRASARASARASGTALRGLAPLFAAVAGAFSGYMVLPMRAVQLAAGDEVARWLATPYPYLFVLGGFGGFLFMQFAYKDGEMGDVAPANFGLQVLWPALFSYFAFAAPFDPLQAAAIALIAACVIVLGRGGGARAGR